MKNPLQIIIREAFNTAYKNHRAISLLKESSERLAKTLTPEQKSKADAIINTLATKGPGWDKYQWNPSQSPEESKEWNYIIERMSELAATDEKYKDVIANMYPFAGKTVGTGAQAKKLNSALYNNLFSRLKATTPLERLEIKYPGFFYDALSKVWGRLFAGGKIDPKKGKYAGQKNIDAWKRLIDDYESSGQSNFGAYLAEVIKNDVTDLIYQEAESLKTSSLDKPTATGKAGELGDDEADLASSEENDEFGDNDNDNENDFESELNSDEYFAGVSNDTDSGDEENIAGSDSEDPGVGGTDSIDYADEREKGIVAMVEKFKSALVEIIRISKTHADLKNSKGLIALQELGLNFLDYNEIAAKYPELFSPKDSTENNDVKIISSLLKTKSLVKSANEILADKNLSYDIFADSNWQEKYGLGPEVVSQILDLYNASIPAKTSATIRNPTMFAFKEYALNHLTPSQIAEKISSVEKKSYKKEPKAAEGGEAVRAALGNLLSKNQTFQNISDSVLMSRGLNLGKRGKKEEDYGKSALENVNWSDWVKAGKEYLGIIKSKQPVADTAEERPDKYVWEEFLSDNLDKIIERVYKRLEKLL